MPRLTVGDSNATIYPFVHLSVRLSCHMTVAQQRRLLWQWLIS